MSPRTPWWRIYAPRGVWYFVVLPLLALGFPRWLLEPVVLYWTVLLGFLALDALGISTTGYFFAHRYEPAPPPGSSKIDLALGGLGGGGAALGAALHATLVEVLGFVSVFVAVDRLLLAREARCRAQARADPEHAPQR